MSDAASAGADFDAFVKETQGRVRRALTPAAGTDAARTATTDALVHAWRNWERVRIMKNPAGYVYAVARSRVRRERPIGEVLPVDLVGTDGELVIEPRLVPLLAALPERQRVAVYLIYGCRWPTPDVASVLGVSVSTVRNHARRALTRLRRDLEVVDHEQP
jgi:DNA-directed RNA polymerase specialized sigma24 family protein